VVIRGFVADASTGLPMLNHLCDLDSAFVSCHSIQGQFQSVSLGLEKGLFSKASVGCLFMLALQPTLVYQGLTKLRKLLLSLNFQGPVISHRLQDFKFSGIPGESHDHYRSPTPFCLSPCLRPRNHYHCFGLGSLEAASISDLIL
jgi:hypothetical protein